MASWWQDILGTGLAGGVAATAGPTAGLIAGIWTNLRDYKMWRSLGWLLLGILLMTLGAFLLAGRAVEQSPIGRAAEGLA